MPYIPETVPTQLDKNYYNSLKLTGENETGLGKSSSTDYQETKDQKSNTGQNDDNLSGYNLPESSSHDIDII